MTLGPHINETVTWRYNNYPALLPTKNTKVVLNGRSFPQQNSVHSNTLMKNGSRNLTRVMTQPPGVQSFFISTRGI